MQGAAQHTLVEGRELFGVFAVDDDGAKHSDHFVGVAVIASAQTTRLFNMGDALREVE